MILQEIMLYLEEHGNEQTKKIFDNHGIPDPKFGVKVADLKVIQKKIKKNYALSMDLFETRNYDAMYLAGLIADENSITKADLVRWLELGHYESIACNTVAWITAESNYGFELAREWMNDDDETTAAAGWAVWTSLISTKSNTELDINEIDGYLERILEVIHQERNQVKYQMNGFVIAAGGYIPELADKAKVYGEQIGKVDVYMGNTACKVPLIKPYIEKMEARAVKKKRQARC